jgi:hypothetical protein
MASGTPEELDKVHLSATLPHAISHNGQIMKAAIEIRKTHARRKLTPSAKKELFDAIINEFAESKNLGV